jgi:hypothetical protein
MAETLISPGVLARENDNSFVSTGPIRNSAAIVGPTVIGPVEVPTIVTSYSDYTNRFGSTFLSASNVYSFFTSIAAYNFFANGGETLLVTRVASGSFGPATSSATQPITNGVLLTTASLTGFDLTPFSASYSSSGASSFVLNGITVNFTGSAQANTSTQININASTFTTPTNFAAGVVSVVNTSASVSPYSNTWQYLTASNSTANLSLFTTSSIVTSSISGTAVYNANVLNSYYITSGSTTTYFSGATNNVAITLTTISDGIVMNSSSSIDVSGSLASGSQYNLRWQITNSNTSSGTFDLLIRRGDDNTNNTAVLETWTNLSLDPTQPNFISRVIGDQYENLDPNSNSVQVYGNYKTNSRYVYVSSITASVLTPNYFTNSGLPNTAYAFKLPLNISGTFNGAVGDVKGGANFYNTINSSNTQGLVASNYTNAIAILANADAYKFNVLVTPGLYNSDTNYDSQMTTIINNTQNRGDNIYVADLVPYSSSVTSVTQLFKLQIEILHMLLHTGLGYKSQNQIQVN